MQQGETVEVSKPKSLTVAEPTRVSEIVPEVKVKVETASASQKLETPVDNLAAAGDPTEVKVKEKASDVTTESPISETRTPLKSKELDSKVQQAVVVLEDSVKMVTGNETVPELQHEPEPVTVDAVAQEADGAEPMELGETGVDVAEPMEEESRAEVKEEKLTNVEAVSDKSTEIQPPTRKDETIPPAVPPPVRDPKPAETSSQMLQTTVKTKTADEASPQVPEPESVAPVAAAPVAAAPVAAAPESVALVASAPVAAAPEASAPVASAPVALSPGGLSPGGPSSGAASVCPVAPAPEASAPVAPAPEASAPVAAAPESQSSESQPSTSNDETGPPTVPPASSQKVSTKPTAGAVSNLQPAVTKSSTADPKQMIGEMVEKHFNPDKIGKKYKRFCCVCLTGTENVFKSPFLNIFSNLSFVVFIHSAAKPEYLPLKTTGTFSQITL